MWESREKKERIKVRHKHIRHLFLFELLYLTTFLLLAYLILRFVFRMLLKITGYSYLTLENMKPFFLHPATIIVAVMILIGASAASLLENVSLIVFYQGYVRERKVSLSKIFFPGLRETAALLHRANRPVVLFYAFWNALPGLLPLLVILAIRFRVPAYLAKLVVGQKVGVLFVVLLGLFCLVVYIFGIYTLHYCVLEECSLQEGFRKSSRFVAKKLRLFFIYFLGINIAHYTIGYISYLIAQFLSCYIMYCTRPKNVAMAAMLTAYDDVMLVMGIFITISGQVVVHAALTMFFAKYSTVQAHQDRIEKWQEQMEYEDVEWEMDYSAGHGGLRKIRGWYSKILAGGITILFLVGGFTVYDVVRNGSLIDRETLFGIHITAHRGASADAPENSVAALELAIEQMADYAEIDVRETKDGVLVLMHDSSAKRTAGRNRKIEAMTLDEVRHMEIGSWFSKMYENERIPTLEEVMELCKGRIQLNIELKPGKSEAAKETMAKRVTELIRDYDMENQCVVSCSDLAVLGRIKELRPEIKTGYIMAFAYGSFYNEENVDFFSIKSSFLNDEMVRDMHAAGKEVHAWTVNSNSEMQRMKQIGVDNIITDYAIRAREVVYGEEDKIDFIKMFGFARH